MWVFTIDGFFSAVQKPKDRTTGRIQVRARNREDLVRFKSRMNLQNRILSTPAGDYPFRIVTSKKAWGKYLDRMARIMEYGNFKAECDRMGLNRGGIYHRVWSILQNLEAPRSRRSPAGQGRLNLQDDRDPLWDPYANRRWSVEDEQLFQSQIFKDINVTGKGRGYGFK